jgi:ACR3 family arsenite efflux pump ArsB
MRTAKWILIGLWVISPWLFWTVYQFHSPDHADVFWTAAMPLVIVSCQPMLLSHSATEGAVLFPTGMVAWCSIFNLVAGVLIFTIVKTLKKNS